MKLEEAFLGSIKILKQHIVKALMETEVIEHFLENLTELADLHDKVIGNGTCIITILFCVRVDAFIVWRQRMVLLFITLVNIVLILKLLLLKINPVGRKFNVVFL